MYPDLSARHDWSVKNAIVDLPIRLKENLKCIPVSPLGAQNEDMEAASRTLLSGVKLRLLTSDVLRLL